MHIFCDSQKQFVVVVAKCSQKWAGTEAIYEFAVWIQYSAASPTENQHSQLCQGSSCFQG